MQPNYENVIKLDCKNIRKERQKINNLDVFECLMSKNKERLNKLVNKKELDRVIDELEITYDELLEKCSNDRITSKILSGRISKKASRQGTKDETLQLNTCNILTTKYEIFIENLSATAFRCTRDGKIISQKELKKNKIKKSDCLKSFDGRIYGNNLNGWIFAKVVYGHGGHQDNVFIEAHDYCHWVKQFGNQNELYVVLIDTDLYDKFNDLKKKYNDIDNILIVNHIDFQKYIIDHYTINNE